MAWIHSRRIVVEDGERSYSLAAIDEPLHWRTSLIVDAPADGAAFVPPQIKVAHFGAKSNLGQLVQISCRVLSANTRQHIDVNVAEIIEPPWEIKDVLIKSLDPAQGGRYTIIVNRTATEPSSSLNHNTWSRWKGNVIALLHGTEVSFGIVICYAGFTDGLEFNSPCYIATHDIDGGISLPVLTCAQFGDVSRVEDAVIKTASGSYHYIYHRQPGPWTRRVMRWMILKRGNDRVPTGLSTYVDFHGANILPEVHAVRAA
ncbi:hypothetical protein HWV62_8845 [Athelia sp. TMB]|nr:hypothetical protein HWV62_8845 [Athelia sp. TMB]